jgi:hypothetical protein
MNCYPTKLQNIEMLQYAKISPFMNKEQESERSGKQNTLLLTRLKTRLNTKQLTNHKLFTTNDFTIEIQNNNPKFSVSLYYTYMLVHLMLFLLLK